MAGDDFLDSLAEQSRPEPNVRGNFDCMTCREAVGEAYYDVRKNELRWWCSDDHESVMEKAGL